MTLSNTFVTKHVHEGGCAGKRECEKTRESQALPQCFSNLASECSLLFAACCCP